jgi:hypothetical protein
MPKRVCDVCGKNKEVNGGKTCEKGHFICQNCLYKGTGGGLFGGALKTCPLCKRVLR